MGEAMTVPAKDGMFSIDGQPLRAIDGGPLTPKQNRRYWFALLLHVQRKRRAMAMLRRHLRAMRGRK